MGTIAQKLEKLSSTKNAIKSALISKGISVADSDTFASYATKINSIKSIEAITVTINETNQTKTKFVDYIYSGADGGGTRSFRIFNTATSATITMAKNGVLICYSNSATSFNVLGATTGVCSQVFGASYLRVMVVNNSGTINVS